MGHGGAAAVYYEAASVIISLVLLGQIWELRARQQTGSSEPSGTGTMVLKPWGDSLRRCRCSRGIRDRHRSRTSA